MGNWKNKQMKKWIMENLNMENMEKMENWGHGKVGKLKNWKTQENARKKKGPKTMLEMIAAKF